MKRSKIEVQHVECKSSHEIGASSATVLVREERVREREREGRVQSSCRGDHPVPPSPPLFLPSSPAFWKEERSPFPVYSTPLYYSSDYDSLNSARHYTPLLNLYSLSPPPSSLPPLLTFYCPSLSLSLSRSLSFSLSQSPSPSSTPPASARPLDHVALITLPPGIPTGLPKSNVSFLPTCHLSYRIKPPHPLPPHVPDINLENPRRLNRITGRAARKPRPPSVIEPTALVSDRPSPQRDSGCLQGNNCIV